MNTVKSLRRAGIPAEVWPVVDVHDLRMRLERAPQVTHAVISAPWIPTADLQRLTTDYLEIQFAVNCHSNVGFLQADSNGVRLFGEGLEIERGSHNFRMAGNSRKFTNWVQAAFGVPCAYLPNLYYLDEHVPAHLPVFGGGILRIGAFGATRVLKNLMSAAGAAMAISRRFRRGSGAMDQFGPRGRGIGRDPGDQGDVRVDAARARGRGGMAVLA